MVEMGPYKPIKKKELEELLKEKDKSVEEKLDQLKELIKEYQKRK